MATAAQLIEGTYNEVCKTLEWECPFTGNLKNAWGEFDYGEDVDGKFYYSHDVYNENDQIVYTVIAK